MKGPIANIDILVQWRPWLENHGIPVCIAQRRLPKSIGCNVPSENLCPGLQMASQ